ncbi:MAG: glycosyltransferase [Candidatus Limnocylindrales bacterium]
MRILLAHSFYRLPGGEDRYVRQQAELLRTRHTVELLARHNLELEETIGTAARMTFSPGELRETRALMRRFRPDVVHLHNVYPSLGPAVHLAAERRGTPIVMTVHNLRLRCPNGLMFTQDAPCRRCEGGAYQNAIVHECFPTRTQASVYASALWVHRFVLRLDEKVDLFVAPSRFLEGRLHDWGIAPERTAMVRNFTDLALGEPGGGEVGLFLGRLSREKGVASLLRGLQLAGDPPFRIAGDGPEAASLQALAQELGLRRTVFLGQLDRTGVGQALRDARYVAFPSIWDENAPLAALEAMAAARPLLVSRRGGLPELVDEGGGLIYEPDDEASLADAIGRLAHDPTLAATEGARALEFARTVVQPDRHLAELEAVYERARERTRSEAAQRTAAPVLVDLERRPAAPVAPPRTPRGPSVEAPLRVLMSHCYYRDLGGENLSFEAEVDLLRAYGQDVRVYARDNRELDRIGSFGKVRAGLQTVWAADSYSQLTRLLKEQRPDVAHFQNTFPLISPAALHAAHRQGVPVVMALRNYRLLCVSGVLYRDGRVCEDCLHTPLSLPGIAHACYHDSHVQSAVVATMQSTHRLLRTWTEAVDLFVAPTAFGRHKFIEAGLPPDRIVVKPNFVSPDPGPNPEPGAWAVYAGRLAPEKGVMTLLEAWRRSAPLPLRIVGDGPLRRTVEAFVREHELQDRIEILGFRRPQEVMTLMRQARLVIFPSEWYETFGRVAAEAFACGVPVIAARLGAMSEVVEDGLTGLHFVPGDPDDLAAKVTWALAHPAEMEEMGVQARLEYERTYTAEQNYHRLMDIYRLARERAGSTVRAAG